MISTSPDPSEVAALRTLVDDFIHKRLTDKLDKLADDIRDFVRRQEHNCARVSIGQLIPVAVLSAVLLTAMWFWRGRLSGLLFYGLFALAITASVQLVGVYLVFASLIVPALATVGIAKTSRRLALAYVIGACGYVSGLVLSAVLDLPSGAVIVWTLAACALAWALKPGRASPK